jgi:hypothetical protein
VAVVPAVIGRPGAGGGSCPASFRDYERAVILSSLSGTVVARDESLPVWADVEAAMELDLLGVAVRGASLADLRRIR